LIYDDFPLHIKKGELVSIVGPSGSGKSTLLKSLYGELPVKKGQLFVNKIDISKINKSKLLTLRKSLGIVFQDYKLISDYTIEENIMLPLELHNYDEKVSKNQVKNLLKHVQLSHKTGAYPLELSGGEQQRVAMARALAHNPKLIVADEPTGNLDEYSSEVIWNLLKNVKNHLGSTIIVVTHKIPSAISLNYRQFYLNNGSLHEII